MGKNVMTMDEYIKRETAIEAIMSDPPDAHYQSWYAEKINEIPAAEVAPVRHGRWIMKKTSAGASYTVCSYCNASVKYNDEYGTVIMNLNGANYCPNCGAKMDGGDGNDDAE